MYALFHDPIPWKTFYSLIVDPIIWKTIISIIGGAGIIIIAVIFRKRILFSVFKKRGAKKTSSNLKDSIDPGVLKAVTDYAKEVGTKNVEKLREENLKQKEVNDKAENNIRLAGLTKTDQETDAEITLLETETRMNAAAIEKGELEITLAKQKLEKARLERRMKMEETIADLEERIEAHKLAPKKKK